MPRTPLARPRASRTLPPTNSVQPPMRSRPHVLPHRQAAAPTGGGESAGGLECQWQRGQLPEAIRELVLDDQRLRNDICWSVFDCREPPDQRWPSWSRQVSLERLGWTRRG